MSKIHLNGGKKGFVRLSNEDAVLLNDSGSEVELLDVTEMNSSGGNMKRRKKRSSSEGCCCGSCCVSFYLLLLTLLFTVLTVFSLFLAYDFKLMKAKVEQMETKISKFEKDIESLNDQHKKESKNHTSWLSDHNSWLSNHTSWLLSFQQEATALNERLKLLSKDVKQSSSEIAELKLTTSQIGVKQMQKFNASLVMVASFSNEVTGIHTSMAQLGSRMDGLENQMTSSDKHSNDLETQIDKVKETLGDVKDSVSLVKADLTTRNSFVDSKLTSLTEVTGNHSESISRMSQLFNQSLLHQLLMAASNASADIARLENEALELQNSVRWIKKELSNLTKQEAVGTSSIQEGPGNNEEKGSESKVNSSKPTNSEVLPGGNTGSDNEHTGHVGETGSQDTETMPEDKQAGSENTEKLSKEDETGSKEEEDKETASSDKTQNNGETNSSEPGKAAEVDGDLPSYKGSTEDTQATESVPPINEATPLTVTEQNTNETKTSNTSVNESIPNTNPHSTVQGEETTPSTNELVTPPKHVSTPSYNYSSVRNESEVSLDNADSKVDANDSIDTPSSTEPEYESYDYPGTMPSNGGDSVPSDSEEGGVDDTGESPEDTSNKYNDKVEALKSFLGMFDDVDINKDTMISHEEFDQVFPNRQRVFEYLDIDQNGSISKEEVLVAITTEESKAQSNSEDTPYERS